MGGVGVVAGEGFRGCRVGGDGCVSAPCSVGSMVVVVFSEGVELCAQLGGCLCAGSCREPAFERLVEAFDLALGLRVVRCAVLLSDLQSVTLKLIRDLQETGVATLNSVFAGGRFVSR